METFETNLEACFCSRSYALTGLKSIWYGRGACVLIFPATKVQNIPMVPGMNEMTKNEHYPRIAWTELKLIEIYWY